MTSIKHAKFKIISLSAFRDVTSQKSSQEGNESSQYDIYPLEASKTREKLLFMPENIFFGPKLCPPC